MKKYIVVNAADIFARPQIIKAHNFRSALQWCFKHNYDLIEEA